MVIFSLWQSTCLSLPSAEITGTSHCAYPFTVVSASQIAYGHAKVGFGVSHCAYSFTVVSVSQLSYGHAKVGLQETHLTDSLVVPHPTPPQIQRYKWVTFFIAVMKHPANAT